MKFRVQVSSINDSCINNYQWFGLSYYDNPADVIKFAELLDKMKLPIPEIRMCPEVETTKNKPST